MEPSALEAADLIIRSWPSATPTRQLVASAYAAGQAEALAWRPIETAPRDGTVVDLLVRFADGLARAVDCNFDGAYWRAKGHPGWCIDSAIGWMPPPSVAVPPPAAEPAREDAP